MHILMIRSALVDMGPGTQPLALALELHSRGHRVSFATSGGVFAPEVEKRGFKVFVIPALAPDRHDAGSLIEGALALRRLIRTEKIDVLHGHNAAATLYGWVGGVLGRRFLPAATSVRGVEERGTHQRRNRIWRMLPGTLIAVCEKARERLIGFGVPTERIIVSYNGVDLGKFNPDSTERGVVRAELGLKDEIVVATVGAMVGGSEWKGPSKGQDLVVQALAKLQGRLPALRVMLVGDGDMRASVEDTARRLNVTDKVLFMGRRFDVARLLAAADIYCLPSVAGEFFPNSIVEAMAMGKPWIGSDIAGLGELTANGAAGLLVKVGDVDGLAHRIHELATNGALRAEMGRRARVEVEERFTIVRVVDRVLAAYAKAGARISA
jgi:glycosyltransferase involved in cell wall biosynthesis